MSNGWTGGQYSLFRVLLGGYLVIHFAHLLPWAPEILSSRGMLPDGRASPLLLAFPNVLALYDAPWVTIVLVAAAIGAAVCFTLGWRDRVAAIVLWYVLACIYGRNPLTLNPSLPFVGWMLLAHALLPPAPYGSVAARGRPDPGGGWTMPPGIFAAAWIVMALGYSYSGWAKLGSPSWIDGSAFGDVLENPLARATWIRGVLLALPPVLLQVATWGALATELLFAPLALSRRLRPWVWSAAVLMHLGLLLIVDFADLTLGMLALHGFTFDPRWLPSRLPKGAATFYYDGVCGLCHRVVRFLLAEDAGARLRLSPLQGADFAASVPEEERRSLPDTIVVRTADGRLLVGTRGAVYVLIGVGGVWKALGICLSMVPTRLADIVYDFVSRNRRRWFAPPETLCPIVPEALRARFVD